MTIPEQQVIGWREWIVLSQFGGTRIKAKVDTGARTSALHTFYITPFERDGKAWVKFGLHPLQRDADLSIECEAPIKDKRKVTDSGGHSEMRYVIEIPLTLSKHTFMAEVTLTNREKMRFRMLLGRSALEKHAYLVDSAQSFVLGGDKYHPPA